MISDNEITALLGRGGYDPDRLLSRRDTSLLLHRLWVSLSERTIAKNVALRRDAPPYRIIAGRALSSPRDVVRWALNRPLRASASDPTKEGETPAA
jgi:hypothetical protein